MAKYVELGDDSALVKALDDAISKYKIMHNKGGASKLLDEEKITICTEESESREAKSACINTDGNQVQDTDSTYVDAQTAEDYNVLLNQYNTVEEQRQKLLGQLYQYGNWDYDYQSYGYESQKFQQPQPVCSCSEDSCVIKAAMGAIEKAVQTFKTEDKEEVETSLENVVKDKTSQKTDISVVLNAWFSAGFYTGKYLSEQASGKK